MTRSALLLPFLLTGCGLGLAVEGNGSPGDQGLTSWQVIDGLCSNVGNGCPFDEVRVAAGIAVPVIADAELHRSELERAYTVSSDAGDIEDLRVVDDHFSFDLRTFDGGDIELSVVRADDDEVYDSVRLRVAEPAAIVCGHFPRGRDGVEWRMENLVETSNIQEEVFDRFYDGDPLVEESIELGCRLEDADGRPLLSADDIQWRTIESDSGASLSRTDGARVHVDFDDPDRTVTVRASFRELEADLTVTALQAPR